MNKEFIPYEQALELKELGFNENCMFPYHRNNTEYIDSAHVELVNYNATEELVSAVLYQQAFRFFREKGFLMDITSHDKDVHEFYIRWHPNKPIFSDYYNTYEETELECLKKLIEIAKNK